MKKLNLILKRRWYDVTPAGGKNFQSRLFDGITLWKGYTKTHRNFWAGLDEFFKVSISKIDPGIWDKYETYFLKDGYEKEKYYFCIPLTEKYFDH